MSETLQELKDELQLLKQSQRDNDSAGGLKTFKKGDTVISYIELTDRIKELTNKISLMEINDVE